MAVIETASDYDRRLAELSTVAFWQLPELHESTGPERAHVWHWDEVVPELLASRDIEEAGATQRRALLFRNPGLPSPALGATPTLVAAYQMLLPGEAAPVHAHSPSALRFGLVGPPARLTVDDDVVPLERGDLVLTPAWCWHGHEHPGGDEPSVWFDTLDVPFVMALRAAFFRFDADDRPPAAGPAPVRRYPWAEAYGPLQTLMAAAGDEAGATFEYRDAATGGPVLATLACLLQGVRAGRQTPPVRETASSVGVVIRGSGAALVGGQRLELRTNDAIALPAWTWYHLCAGDDELVVFRVSDRPLHDAFGLYRSETRPAALD